MRIIGVILAGGDSQRMGGRDKALVTLAGKRLIDHVLARLAPRVDSVIIAGPSDYGSGLVTLGDIPGGAEGPVAGIRATYCRLVGERKTDDETAAAIVTVPVDCPFFPDDLVMRLSKTGAAAVAEGDDRLQPAFGFWPLNVIEMHIAALEKPGWLSLQRWAKLCGAATISFGSTGAFFNINDADDLAEAERLTGDRKPT